MKPPAPVTTMGAEVDDAVSDGQTLQFSMAEDCIVAPGRPEWAPHGFWVFFGRARAFVSAGLPHGLRAFARVGCSGVQTGGGHQVRWRVSALRGCAWRRA